MSTSSWLLCPLDTCLWFLELFILWGKLSPAYLTLYMPVGLSLSIVMLLLGMPGALLTWAHSCYSSPHRHYPHWSPCCGWSCPCGSWLWPSGNFEMASLLCTCPGGYKACLGPHSKVLGRERDGSWANLDLCFCLVGVNGWVPGVSSQYLLVTKDMSEN